MPIIERIERKYLIIVTAVGMAMFGLAFGYAESTTTILVFGFLYTAISNVFSNAVHVYQAEIFPT
ncbi:MAG: MFS transporter, partial [Pseudonocardiaceae bacterium]